MITRKHDAVLSFLLFLNLVLSSSESDAQLLLKFKASLKNTTVLVDWNASTAPCSSRAHWNGILCHGGLVWGLQLQHMDLQGFIDVETLAKLPHLRSVSFMNNDLGGSLPNFTKLGALKTIFLSDNKFSGEIPANAFHGMMSLKKLHLAYNKFSGRIPTALTTLPKLMELTLQGNQFDGQIPNFQGLKLFNASNNKLDGPIPPSLSYFHASSFSGNKGLCGTPLEQCHNTKFPTIMIVGGVLIALLAPCIFFFFFRRSWTSSSSPLSHHQLAEVKVEATAMVNIKEMERGSKRRRRKLTFLKEQGGSKRFEMQELLRASAEVLGGSSYKAGLNGRMMVVKRLKHMNKVSKQEFNEHMRRLGRMSHPNVHPILAFYYKKGEKLLVSEFAPNLSLAAQLHGRNQESLDWGRRVNIVKGVAKGLVYLHKHLPTLSPAHGNLKASNVLLDASLQPLLTDYGLLPILNKDMQAQRNFMAYNSPDSAKLNKKTDVWSFGILVLEILTNRKPEHDLASWLHSIQSSQMVFAGSSNGGGGEGEMMKLFNIALRCCQTDIDSRPHMKEVMGEVEGLCICSS